MDTSVRGKAVGRRPGVRAKCTGRAGRLPAGVAASVDWRAGGVSPLFLVPVSARSRNRGLTPASPRGYYFFCWRQGEVVARPAPGGRRRRRRRRRRRPGRTSSPCFRHVLGQVRRPSARRTTSRGRTPRRRPRPGGPSAAASSRLKNRATARASGRAISRAAGATTARAAAASAASRSAAAATGRPAGRRRVEQGGVVPRQVGPQAVELGGRRARPGSPARRPGGG